VAQAAADEAQHRANIALAVSDVIAGYTTLNEAKVLYDVRYQTIQGRVRAAAAAGTPGSSHAVGRRPIFSPQTIAAEQGKTRARDDKLRSRQRRATCSRFSAKNTIKLTVPSDP